MNNYYERDPAPWEIEEAERRKIARERAEEREKAAQIAESFIGGRWPVVGAEKIAKAIREGEPRKKTGGGPQ